MKKVNLLIMILVSIISCIFIYNDDFLYKDSIMKITDIKTIKTDNNSNSLGLTEKYYTLKISGVITNGKNKGKRQSVKYEESYSSVVTDRYKKNDKIFIKNNTVEGLKRDFYLAILIFVFIDLMYLVGEYKGLLSILSVVLNMIIFYIGLSLYFRGVNLLFLCVLESLIFSVLSLFIAGGINKKTIEKIN